MSLICVNRNLRPAVGLFVCGALALALATWLTTSASAGPLSSDPASSGFDQREPAVTAVGDGRYLLVWVEDRGTGSDIYGKFLHANGRAVGGANRRGNLVVRESADPDHGPRHDPSMAGATSPPGVFLVWSELRSDTDGHDIFGIHVSTSGYSRSTPKLLVGGPGEQRRPFVLASGREYLLVWDDNTREPTEIWGRYFSAATSRPRGEAFPLVQGPGNAEDGVVFGVS